jgi:hypothetical protein
VSAPYPLGYQAIPSGGKAPATLADAADKSWVERIARSVIGLLQGKLNASLAVTLASGTTSTAVHDARISATSTLLLQPTTAHAAALLYASPFVLIGTQQVGQAVFNHANTTNTDQTFNLLIIG